MDAPPACDWGIKRLFSKQRGAELERRILAFPQEAPPPCLNAMVAWQGVS